MGSMREIKTNEQTIPAYLATPEGEAKGAIIVIHEVWGLNDHTKEIADRFAAEGYLALAPDLLSDPEIDTSSMAELQEGLFDPERTNEIQPELRRLMAPLQNPEFGTKTTKSAKACFDYLYDMPEAKQKVAIVGFCFGGSYSFNLAVAEPRLVAAIPFYGHSDHAVDNLKQIKCPVLAFYGEHDTNLMEGLDDLREKMKEAGVDFTAKVYPDCGHAFFNDTNRFAYNEAAAKDAWLLTLRTLERAVS